MGVSLNIMKRELEAMGNVSISSDGSLNFENARLYLGESSIAGDDILYVCSTSEDCESVRGYGRHAAFVDHHATKPDQTAVLSVTGERERSRYSTRCSKSSIDSGCGSAIWTRCSAAAAGFKSLWM